MSDYAGIIAELREAVELLAESKQPAITLAAFVLSRCLAGEPFHSAASLPTDWQFRLRIFARDRALTDLARLRADLDPTNLARWILRGAARRGDIRRDGALGYVDDLVGSGCELSERNLRLLIGEIRRGKRAAGVCHGKPATSAPTRRSGAKAADSD